MPKPTMMKREVIGVGFDVLQVEMYKVAYNAACNEWEKWHEKLRLAMGAKPGDDLIEFAATMAALKYEPEDVKRLQNSVTKQANLIDKQSVRIDELVKQNRKLKSDVVEASDVIARLQEDTARKQKFINEQQRQLSIEADVIAQLRDISDIRLREIERLYSIIDEDSKEIECNRLRVVLEEKDDEIEQLNERIAGKDDMLDTAAKVISLQRDAMALLLESAKTQKGEPDES